MTNLEQLLLNSLEQLATESKRRESNLTTKIDSLTTTCTNLAKQVQNLAAIQIDYQQLDQTCKHLRQELRESHANYTKLQQQVESLVTNWDSLQTRWQQVESQSVKLNNSTQQSKSMLEQLFDKWRKSNGGN